MNKDTMHKLATQLLDCQDEQKKLHETIEHMREQFAEMERHHKTALENAYEEGYRAGQRDTRPIKPR